MSNYNRKAAHRAVHERVRKRVSGSLQRPRLAVHFSGRHVYAQVIDDEAGQTIAAATSMEQGVRSGRSNRANVDIASQIGKSIAERAQSKKVKQVVFDRGGFHYHGKVKALADAAREAGLEF